MTFRFAMTFRNFKTFRHLASFIFPALLLAAAPAMAQSAPHMSQRLHIAQSSPVTPQIVQAQSPRVIDPACFCWANGERFNRGETACLRTGQGRRLAQCDQVTNVMSWSFSTNDCPES